MRRLTMPAALAAAIAASACAVVTPPPMLLLHEPVVQPEPGEWSFLAAGGAGAGVFTREFAGGAGGFEYQASRTLSVGVTGGGGASIDPEGDDRLTAVGFGRAHLAFRPERAPWLALRAGLGGGGADSGLGYVTMDAGASAGWSFARRVRLYGGLAAATAVPFRSGAMLDVGSDEPRVPGHTLYVIAAAGTAVRLAGRLDLSFEVSGTYGSDFRSDAITAGALTGGLRWTTGGLDTP